MNGGQWPQTRKAKVASWNITDDMCQFCFAEPGTLQHRHRCAATAEARCSIPPPKEAQFAHTKFNDDRLQLLQLRAVAVVKVPAPKPRTVGSFCWLVDPFLAGQDQLHTATWYTDGSMLMGKWAPLRCTGFGVVVVSQCGALLGYGYGSPPSRITTAAAAELWAVDFVLALETHTQSISAGLFYPKESLAHPLGPPAPDIIVRVAFRNGSPLAEAQESDSRRRRPAASLALALRPQACRSSLRRRRKTVYQFS